VEALFVRALAVLPLGLFLVMTTVVGLRLLGLARRTRELPELAIGAGLSLIGLIGMPLSALGRLPGQVGSTWGDASFAVGIAAVHVGIGLIFLFTWSVFRRGTRGGSLALWLSWTALAIAGVGMIVNGTGETDFRLVLASTRPWALASVGLIAVCFLWSGGESARFYAMLRRRLEFGLADPVVTNRFGLWAVAGAACALLCGVLLGCLAAGMVVLQDTLPLTTCALMGSLSSVAFYLSFLPPKQYLASVRARSSHQAA
jgi:hypothetical protein